jgi:glyoxylase-like metal-dependent hydrolase (beta-lactamase superfamily II)
MTNRINAYRRSFLGFGLGSAALLAAGSGAWPGLTALAREAENFVKGPPMPDIAPTRLSEHVWMIHAKDGFPTPENQGMMCNVSFVLTSKGVVVLDTGASVQIGEMALRQIRKLSDKPVIALFNSHYHGDHWLGNHAFVDAYGAALPIYAHPHSKKEIEGMQGDLWRGLMEKSTNQGTAGTRVVPPNRATQHGAEFTFGDVTLRVHDYGKAHTPGDICVEVVQDKLTHIGDVAMNRRIANMDDGSFLGSLRYYDGLEKNAASRIWVPGHGKADADVLKWNRELFEGIYQPCEAAVKAGRDMAAARAAVLADPRVSSRGKETQGFEANIGKYVSLAYLEAEAVAF